MSHALGRCPGQDPTDLGFTQSASDLTRTPAGTEYREGALHKSGQASTPALHFCPAPVPCTPALNSSPLHLPSTPALHPCLAPPALHPCPGPLPCTLAQHPCPAPLPSAFTQHPFSAPPAQHPCPTPLPAAPSPPGDSLTVPGHPCVARDQTTPALQSSAHCSGQRVGSQSLGAHSRTSVTGAGPSCVPCCSRSDTTRRSVPCALGHSQVTSVHVPEKTAQRPQPPTRGRPLKGKVPTAHALGLSAKSLPGPAGAKSSLLGQSLLPEPQPGAPCPP